VSESSDDRPDGKFVGGQPRASANPSKKFFVYIARCSDATLYTGFTVDPEARIRTHNAGSGSRYTRSRRPVKLAYLREAPSMGEALALEKKIKKMKRGEKLRLCAEYEARARSSSC
jgi:putative endonuclease